MKKLSDERIKEVIKFDKDGIKYEDNKSIINDLKDNVSALKELLKLRKKIGELQHDNKIFRGEIDYWESEAKKLKANQPKFKIAQKVWVVVEHPSGEYHHVYDGLYSGKREIHTVDGIIMELNQIHNIKSEAQAECRKRNGEKK
jgi:hypothetical protein